MKKEFLRFSKFSFISSKMGAGKPVNSSTDIYGLLLSSTGFQNLLIRLSLTPSPELRLGEGGGGLTLGIPLMYKHLRSAKV